MYKLCVIGDPVAHSLSPSIHNALLARRGLAGSYTTVTVRAGELEGFLTQARRGDYDGFNVTMPHKTAAAALCERLSPAARICGARWRVTRRIWAR